MHQSIPAASFPPPRADPREFAFLARSPKDGELLDLEWGMILQVSNIIFPDENSCVRC